MRNTVQKHCRIDGRRLDPNRYTETLMTAAYEAGVYDDAAIQKVQSGLFALLAERLEKLTGGESCSVSADTAQALLQAVLYTVDLQLLGESTPDDAAMCLLQTNATALYEAGLHRIKRRLGAAELQWRKHLSLFRSLPDSVMKTTAIHGMEGFFRAYHPEGFADAVPITADYPLYLDMNEIAALRGVTLLGRYLQNLTDEVRFLSKFREETLHAVLSAADPLYRDNPANLYAPMLATAVAMGMLHRPFSVWKYGLQGEDIDALVRLYDDGLLTEPFFADAAERVIDLLMLDGTCAAYVRRSVSKLCDSAVVCLRRRLPILAFPCTDAAYRHAVLKDCVGGSSLYDDISLMAAFRAENGISYHGERLEPSAFRLLDDDLRHCKTKEEQVDLILSRVKGLEDICDLLTADTGALDASAKAHLLSVLPREARVYLSEMVGED